MSRTAEAAAILDAVPLHWLADTLQRRCGSCLIAYTDGDETTYATRGDNREIARMLEDLTDGIMKELGYAPVPGSGYAVKQKAPPDGAGLN